MTWIKFCGCTSPADVAQAARAGANAVGLIFAPSPRQVSTSEAARIASDAPAGIEVVGVFVDPSPQDIDAALALIPAMTLQFSGDEPPEFVAKYAGRAIKAIHVGEDDSLEELAERCRRYRDARVLFDTKSSLAGGTGRTFDWGRVASIARTRDVVVAGGLTSQNVAGCVAVVRPFGVDVRSGIESGGRKDFEKMIAFREAVRAADAA